MLGIATGNLQDSPTALLGPLATIPTLAVIRDDFLSQVNVNPSTTQGTTVLSSDTNWIAQSIVAAGSISSASSGAGDVLFQNPGQCALLTAIAASGDGVVIYKNQGTGVASFGELGAKTPWESDFIFCLGNGNTASYAFRVGFTIGGQQAGDSPTDGFWVEFDTANASSNTFITFVTSLASVRTYVPSTIVPAINTFYHVRIRSIVPGVILFSINNGPETAISTNVPVAKVSPGFQILTRTTAQAILIVDFFGYAANTGRI